MDEHQELPETTVARYSRTPALVFTFNNYNIARCSVRVWNLVADIEGET